MTSATSSESGYWVPGEDVFVPFEFAYYWHPESDSLIKSSTRLDDPNLEELSEREFILLQLFQLDEEAFDLIADTTAEPSLV
jgi:hypothetical protein